MKLLFYQSIYAPTLTKQTKQQTQSWTLGSDQKDKITDTVRQNDFTLEGALVLFYR